MSDGKKLVGRLDGSQFQEPILLYLAADGSLSWSASTPGIELYCESEVEQSTWGPADGNRVAWSLRKLKELIGGDFTVYSSSSAEKGSAVTF